MNMIFRGQNDNKLTILRGLIKYHACVRGVCVRGATRENRQKQLSDRLARDQCAYRERLFIILRYSFYPFIDHLYLNIEALGLECLRFLLLVPYSLFLST